MIHHGSAAKGIHFPSFQTSNSQALPFSKTQSGTLSNCKHLKSSISNTSNQHLLILVRHLSKYQFSTFLRFKSSNNPCLIVSDLRYSIEFQGSACGAKWRRDKSALPFAHVCLGLEPVSFVNHAPHQDEVAVYISPCSGSDDDRTNDTQSSPAHASEIRRALPHHRTNGPRDRRD